MNVTRDSEYEIYDDLSDNYKVLKVKSGRKQPVCLNENNLATVWSVREKWKEILSWNENRC